eukprot:SAG22_NODE_83_length_21704_cov_58.556584_13_plen_140_part_00
MHSTDTVYPAKDKAWFMPTIVHNPKTGRFALWYYIDGFARGVAVADSAVGPFKIVHHCVPNLGLGSSFFFWTGSDGEVYMKHNGCGGDATIVEPGGACPLKRPKRVGLLLSCLLQSQPVLLSNCEYCISLMTVGWGLHL